MASKSLRSGKKDFSGETGLPTDSTELSPAALTSLLEDHRNAICAAMESRFDQLQNTLVDLSQRTTALESGLSSVDDRVSSLEDRCASMEAAYTKLQAKTADLESRSRRNNIRIVGLPESIEGPHPTTFFSNLLSEVLGDVLHVAPEIDRAHRALTAKPRAGEKPRAVIVKLHYFQIKEQIIRAARAQRGRLQFKGNTIHIFEDYTPEVMEQRNKYRDVLKELYDKGYRPALRFPARLFIRSPDGSEKRLNSVEEAKQLLNSNSTS